MSLSDIPSKLEAVFIQRDINNTHYAQINVSASNAIVYLDEYGKINADKIDDFFIKYGVGSAQSSKSASWASSSLSASYANTCSVYNVISIEYATNAISASYASSSISSSYTLTASYALNGGGGQGSSVSSSWASSSLSSSYSLTSSYGRTSTSSSYSITASFSISSSRAITSSFSFSSLTASYSLASAASGSTESSSYSGFSTSGSHALVSNYSLASLSSSFASSSLTASFLPLATYRITSSYSTNADQLDGNQGNFYQTASNLLSGYILSNRLSGSYNITSSWSTSSISSSYSLTCSYALNSTAGSSTSASWSSRSLSSSYADTLNGNVGQFYQTASNLLSGILPTERLSGNYSITSSWAENINTASYSLTCSYALNSISSIPASSSWASSSISASQSENSNKLKGNSGEFYQTASNLLSGYIHPTLMTGSYNITSSVGVSSYTASIALTTRREVLTSEPVGFVNRISSTLSYNSASGKFDISGSYIIFANGIEYNKGNESITISAPIRGSKYFVYFNTSGILSYASSPWDIDSGNCPIATVYINPINWVGIIGDERHGIEMDSRTHEYIHETFGPRYANGFGWSTLTSSIGTYSISAGEWYDDDNEFTYNILTASKHSYYSGSGMCITAAPTNSIWAGGIPAYNNTTTGQLVSLTSNQYSAFWVYLINGYEDRLYSIYGQRVDGTLANAINNNIPDTLIFGNFPVEEGKLIYRVIVRGNSTISDVTDYRTAQFGTAGSYTSNDHGSLSGLADDDHAQYLLLVGRTGGQNVIGGITSSLQGTSSVSITSSYSLTASICITSSYSNNSLSSTSASYSATSSYVFWADFSTASDFAVASGVSDISYSSSYADICISSSYTLTASYALNGGGGQGSSVSSSWSSQSLSASYLNNYNIYPIYTITASTSIIPLNFDIPEQILNITASTNITFSAVSSSTTGVIQDISVYLYNTSPSNTGLYFQPTWKNMGSIWPTSLTASKSAVISLRSVNNTSTIGAFAPEI